MQEVEFNILNGITKYQRLALDFSSTIDPSTFLTEEGRALASIFYSYIKTFKSKPTRKSILDSDLKTIDAQLVEDFFDQAESVEYNDSDYNYDISKLKHRFGIDRLEFIKDKLYNADLNDVTKIISNLERELGQIKAVNGVKAFNSKSISDHVDAFRQLYIEKTKNPELGKGILTGYSMLDYVKNGLRPADLVIIGGDTGSGKSTFMNNMAVNIWMQNNKIETDPSKYTNGYNVAYYSLEMSFDDCFQRTLAKVADVPSYGLRDAKLSKSEAKAVSQACKFYKNYPYKFHIVDVPRGLTIEQMEIIHEEMKSEFIPDVIFLDYLGLMEDMEEGSDDWLALGKLAGKVHEFARFHNIPIVTAVQLNRIDPTQKAKAVGMHRIGRSSLIATHATLIIQIETRQDEESHGDFIYHILKNRHGEANKSHSVYKKFSTCSILDKPYDSASQQSWNMSDDISGDISDIIGILNE
jgi:replicative DNA helicase